MKLIEKFVKDRKNLINKYPDWNNIKIEVQDGIPIIALPNMQLLAGFAGYLKYQFSDKGKVFFRGEKKFRKSTIPSLFRVKNNNTFNDNVIVNRVNAFNALVDSIPTLYSSNRFKKEDVSPLMQHYSINSYWIDLVDNIFIALWFASHNNNNDSCYIKFFADKMDGEKLLISDLREKHSSLSLRVHCQHGLSATKDVGKWTTENIDLSNHMIAIARLPKETINYGKNLFQKDYIYPNEKLDNTLKLFKARKFSNELNKIISNYDLHKDDLGVVK